MNTYVFDACALIAFFNDEEGADKVENLISGSGRFLISMVNVYEVYYDAMKVGGVNSAEAIFNDIENLPLLAVTSLDKKTIELAANYKVNFGVSLADSIALGLTEKSDAILVTADHHEFDSIAEKKLLPFFWIR